VKADEKAQEFKGDRIQIFEGDFREACKNIKDESVDAVICDPPYLKKFYTSGTTWRSIEASIKARWYLITYTA